MAAAADLLGLDGDAIAHGLGTFTGVGRRLEVLGEPRGVLVIDDYGHHPTAIRATIESLRERYPGRRLWAVHEPLTYHRTAAMLEPLADALAEADEVVIADIWPGRDPDTTIASAEQLASAVAMRTGRPVAAPGSPEDDRRPPRSRESVPAISCSSWVAGARTSSHERLVEGLASADRE